MNKEKKMSVLKIVGYAGVVVFVIAVMVAFYMMINHMQSIVHF